VAVQAVVVAVLFCILLVRVRHDPDLRLLVVGGTVFIAGLFMLRVGALTWSQPAVPGQQGADSRGREITRQARVNPMLGTAVGPPNSREAREGRRCSPSVMSRSQEPP
jgi:hypothetical protein